MPFISAACAQNLLNSHLDFCFSIDLREEKNNKIKTGGGLMR